MSSEWPTKTVQDLVAEGILAAPIDGNHGGIHPKVSDFVNEGVPFIMASDMKNGRVDTNNCAFIAPAQAASLKKGFAKPGDVLLSHKATIGRTALVGTINTEYLVLTPQVTYYRVLDSTRLNNRYLKYYFDSMPFQQTLASWSGAGSTRAYLGITAQRKLPIVLPPIEMQNEVASTLGALDDRIAVLHEINAALEAIVETLFKSWFVDFDPVQAKSEDRIPEGMDEVTAALFSDGFEESASGFLPKGWRIGTVGDLTLPHKNSVSPLNNRETLFEHFSLPAFDKQRMPLLEFGSEIKSNKTTVPPNSVLLSKLNPHIPRVWLPSNVSPNAVCSTEFLVFSPINGASKEFVYCGFTTAKFKESLCQLVTGTSNSHQRVKPENVLSMNAVIPPQTVMQAFTTIVKPLFERIGLNKDAENSLATLRDSLLHRLISGHLRLPMWARTESAAI